MNTPSLNQSDLPETPSKRTRVIREKINQTEIDDINARHARIIRSAAEMAREIIELGERLTSVKNRLRHGKWLAFVEKNFEFTARTATRYMRAAEQKYDPMLSIDPAEFMARIWGNEPKQLTEGEGIKSDVTSDLIEEDEEDYSQHGGPGFEPSFFPDKGQPGFLGFKNIVKVLETEFFGSADFTREAKLEFLNELISWLEAKRKTL